MKLVRAIVQSSILVFLISNYAQAFEIDPEASIADSPTTLMGVNHIGLSVKNLDAMVEFYQNGSGYEVIYRESVSNNPNADKLFGHSGVEYEIAVLEAPNMLFELIEFKHNADKPTVRMAVEGPGMTHTCFQTAESDSGYRRFRDAGLEILSRGDEAVDLGGYGVTYAYGYDPEGNMIEMEQLDPGPLASVPIKQKWIDEGQTMWMTQVALVTPDLDRLTDWYTDVMAFPPYREGDYVEHPRMIDITDEDGLSLKVAFFRMGETTKSMEFWEYRVPETAMPMGKRGVTDFGYSYSLEVGDIQVEYNRMKDLGVEFVGEPVNMGSFWQVYANDIDGNVFALRQWTDPNSPYSIPNLEL